MCDKVVSKEPFMLKYCPDRLNTHKMCDKVVSKEPFMLKYCPDRLKTHKMCDKAVNAWLTALKFNRDWLVTSNMLELLDDAVFSNDVIDLNYIDSNIVTLFCDDMGIHTRDLYNINLGDNSFVDNDLEIIIHVRLMACYNKYK